MQLWAHMCWFEAQRFKAYPLEIVAGVFSRFSEAILYGTFWLVVSQFAAPGSVSATDIIGYYLIITGLTPFFYAGFGIAGMTIELIKSGELSQTLIRPINPILYPWALRTGRNVINILFGVVQIVIGIIVMGGLKPQSLPFLLPVFFNAAALNAAFNIMLSAAAFYLTDARNLKNAFLHLASFLRGERMPIYLMHPGFAHILMLTPFPASMYHLAVVLQGRHLPDWNDILVGSLWAVALLFASIKLWKSGLRHYEATGI